MTNFHTGFKPILIVDDNLQNLEILQGILQDAGYKVLQSRSSKRVVDIANKCKPDLILLDITMPDVDGFEVCRRLKAHSILNFIPVIFISALIDPSKRVKAFKCGGIDYIIKPFQADEVVIRVKTHLSLRHYQHEMEDKNEKLKQALTSLKEAKEHAENANRTKSDFLSTMSHGFELP